MSATIRVPTIFTAVDRFSSTINNMQRGVQGFVNRTEVGLARANRAFRSITPTLSSVQKDLLSFVSTAAITAGVFSVANFGIEGIKSYETSLQSLEAVTGQAKEKFIPNIEKLAKESKLMATDVSASFEKIGSSMSQYLDNPEALEKIARAGIILSKASKQELTPSLEQLTSIMNQFNLSADKANDTINRLTAGEVVGQVSTAKMSTALQQFGAVADANNVTLSESVALIQVLGKKLPEEQLGTASRNLISIISTAGALPKEAVELMRKAGVNTDFLMNKQNSLGDKLKELSKIKNDSIAMSKVFGRENIAAGTIIFDQLGTYDSWVKEVETMNVASEQAAKNSNTLAKAQESVSNAFINALVSGDNLTPGLEKLKELLFLLADNMDSVLSVGSNLMITFLGIKTALVVGQIAIGAYNIALGIQGALSGSASVAIGANAIALKAYIITSKIATGATWLGALAVKAYTGVQWLLNKALTANPIGLIIVAIAALVGLVYIAIQKYDEWGATLLLFMGPLGWIVNIIQSFRRNWEMVTKAFKEGGIVAGIKAIGIVLLDALLMPMQQLLSLLSKIPGMGALASIGIQKITELRQNLGVEGVDKPALDSPQSSQNKTIIEKTSTNKSSLDINLNDKGGNVTDFSLNSPFTPIKVTSTK